MRVDAIVGYVFQADTYCPEHIVAKLTTNPGNVHHADAAIGDAEKHLDLLARLEGIDRMDEHSYDSDQFPKVILAIDADDERCGTCGAALRS